MKKVVRVFTVLLLLANGIGAVYGGFQFMTDPTGAKMQIPLSYLEHSPFADYLIPGIILFIVNGIFSFITVTTIFVETQKYPFFIIAQGILLAGWIVIQVLLLRTIYAPLHVTFVVIGICLIGSGIYLNRTRT